MRAWLTVLVLASGGCLEDNPVWLGLEAATAGSASGTGSDDAWWDCDWSTRARVRVDAPSETLRDVPVLVRLTQGRVDFGEVAPGGHDVRIVLEGTALDHEIESWSPDEGLLWARVPTLDPEQPLPLWVYYGNPDAPDVSSSATWAEPFVGVWHFGDAARDSTVHANRGELTGGLAPAAFVDAAIGSGVAFDGIDDAIDLGPAPVLDRAEGSLTVSLWVNVQQSVAEFDTPFYRGGADVDQAGYDIELGTSSWAFNLSDGADLIFARFGFSPDLSGRWIWLTGTLDRDGDAMAAFVDGALVEQRTLLGLQSTSNDLSTLIGGPFYAPFLGIVDEVRVESVARPAAWIELQHRSMTDGLLTFDPPQSRMGCG